GVCQRPDRAPAGRVAAAPWRMAAAAGTGRGRPGARVARDRRAGAAAGAAAAARLPAVRRQLGPGAGREGDAHAVPPDPAAVGRAMKRNLSGRLVGTTGSAYLRLSQVDKAIGCYEQHLAIARAIGDRQGEGHALGNLGNAYARLGQVDKAIGCYEQRLAIA